MKRSFALTAVIGLLFSLFTSCASVDSAPVIGRWEMQSYANLFTSSLSRTAVTPEEKYVLRFDRTGIFSFTTDCNTISGEYRVKADRLEFLNPFATEMACDNEMVERSIKADIPMITGYKMPDDTTLCLTDDRGNVLIELVRIEDNKATK